MERLIRLLNETNVSDWKITRKTTLSHQAFFIKHELDQHRIAETVHTEVYIYVDVENESVKLRGGAKHEFSSTDSDEEIRKQLEKMKYNATLALNPFFELAEPVKDVEPKSHYNLSDMLKTVISAVRSVKDTDSESINSYEVFVSEYYYEIKNSRGVDVSFNTMDEQIEIVINSRSGDQEIELFHNVDFADKPLDEIKEGILEVFRQASDRNKAVTTSKSNGMTVILTGEDNASFFRYFLMKTSSRMIYGRSSQVRIGDVFQSEEDCDKITVEIKKELPYSSRNMKYTMDGNPAKDLFIAKDGVYTNLWGEQATSYYLGLKEAVPANNYVVSGGSRTAAEMHDQPYLEVVKFSSFIMSPVSGDFGGEIRLGYYHDGEKVIPVTGGSITCNMDTALKTLRMSKETVQYDNCVVPKFIELKNVAVAGK